MTDSNQRYPNGKSAPFVLVPTDAERARQDILPPGSGQPFREGERVRYGAAFFGEFVGRSGSKPGQSYVRFGTGVRLVDTGILSRVQGAGSPLDAKAIADVLRSVSDELTVLTGALGDLVALLDRPANDGGDTGGDDAA